MWCGTTRWAPTSSKWSEITPVSRAITAQLPIHFGSFIGVIDPVVTGVRNHLVWLLINHIPMPFALVRFGQRLGTLAKHKKTDRSTFTPLKINKEPKNEGLENDIPFQTGDFQVPCKFSRVYGYVTLFIYTGLKFNFRTQRGDIIIQSGQLIIFHQPRFFWNKGISLPKSYLLGAQVVWGRYTLTRSNWTYLKP